jgi:hypothetical protein
LTVRPKNHIPALSPVAAVGSSAGNVFFATKAKASVSSVSAFDEDSGFIDELNRSNSWICFDWIHDGKGEAMKKASNLRAIDTDFFPPSIQSLESNNSIHFGKERIILADAHVVPRMDARSPLADQDGSSVDPLAPKAFYAQSLPCTIPAVPGASLSFLMRHAFLLAEPRRRAAYRRLISLIRRVV